MYGLPRNGKSLERAEVVGVVLVTRRLPYVVEKRVLHFLHLHVLHHVFYYTRNRGFINPHHIGDSLLRVLRLEISKRYFRNALNNVISST